MAKWEVKRLFRQEFGKLEGLEKCVMWTRFVDDLLENGAISDRVYKKIINRRDLT